MPKRLYRLSQTEPARSLLIVGSLGTIALEVVSVVLSIMAGAAIILALADGLFVIGICTWAAWAGMKNKLHHMTWASFTLSLLWLATGLGRLLFSPDPTMMLWGPMLLVALMLAGVYIYLAGVWKASKGA